MVRSLLLWGMLAGLCGGLLAAGVAEVAGEGAVGQAIAFEDGAATHPHEAGAAAHAHSHDAGPVARGVQRYVDMPVAVAIYGIAIGGLLALTFAFAYGRLGTSGPAATALYLAAAGFVVVVLVPFLKYPANPPGIGGADTIDRRTELYLTMVAISILAAVCGARVRRWLQPRAEAAIAAAGGVAAFLIVVGAAALALPAAEAVPAGFPAGTLWDFRVASLGVQLVLWAVLGLGLAVGASRVMRVERPSRRHVTQNGRRERGFSHGSRH
jgi:predicted cobalt transporter CbtA